MQLIVDFRNFTNKNVKFLKLSMMMRLNKYYRKKLKSSLNNKFILHFFNNNILKIKNN